MTYEQKYGRPPDGFYQEEAPPEDWQFKNPLVTVSKDGEVKNWLQKTFARARAKPPKMRPISEILNKEAEEVEFIKLDMDKQIKMVAEEHNRGAGPSEVQRKLGIKGAGTYYDRLDKARAMGLVTDDTGNSPDAKARYVPKAINGTLSVPPEAGVDDFASAAQVKLEQAAKLAEEAECLQQAGTIALALEELLGDKSGRVIAALYAEVSAWLSEALEDYRSGDPLDKTFYGPISDSPRGVPIELADVVIRIADLCGHYGIDIETAIRIKMGYNKTRPYRHGNKVI